MPHTPDPATPNASALELLHAYLATPDDRPPGYWDTLTAPEPLPARHLKHPRGRHVGVHLTLTDGERHALARLWRAQRLPWPLVRAARILLLVDEGLPITYLAAQVGVSRRCVYRWIARYQAHGLAAVQPGRGGVAS